MPDRWQVLKMFVLNKAHTTDPSAEVSVMVNYKLFSVITLTGSMDGQ